MCLQKQKGLCKRSDQDNMNVTFAVKEQRGSACCVHGKPCAEHTEHRATKSVS